MSRDEHRNSMKNILLCQSYYLRHDPKEYKAMMPYAPLATLYAASYLRANGYEPMLFDSMLAAGEEEFVAIIDREEPRVVAIYDDNFNYLTKMCLERMRQAQVPGIMTDEFAMRILSLMKEVSPAKLDPGRVDSIVNGV
jgi:hypothetical protein